MPLKQVVNIKLKIYNGVFHVAYGNTSTKDKWCKDTTVKGMIVSTIRVGGTMIDNLEILDGIKILEYVKDKYPNQTANKGSSGVHWYYGCQNIKVGDIIIENVDNSERTDTYGLAIDIDVSNEVANLKPNNISIKSLTINNITSDKAARGLVIFHGNGNIKLGKVNIKGSPTLQCGYINWSNGVTIEHFESESNVEKLNILQISNSSDIRIENSKTKGNTESQIYVESSKNLKFDKIEMFGGETSKFGFFTYNAQNVRVDSIRAEQLLQGERHIGGNISYGYVFNKDIRHKGFAIQKSTVSVEKYEKENVAADDML